jgi:hypothetical protein
MEECVRAMQQRLRAAPSIKKRAKSVYSQRNLGTIKDRKREKKEEKEVGGGETIMRILRMRYVFSTQTSGFSFCTYTDAPRPLQTEYDRLHRATIANPGDDAGRAGTTRAPAAAAEGPEARRRSPHPRSTSRAGNTSLTSGVEYRTTASLFRRVNTNSFFSLSPSLWIPCTRNPYHPSTHPSIIPSLLYSLLATSLGSLFIIIVALFFVS